MLYCTFGVKNKVSSSSSSYGFPEQLLDGDILYFHYAALFTEIYFVYVSMACLLKLSTCQSTQISFRSQLGIIYIAIE